MSYTDLKVGIWYRCPSWHRTNDYAKATRFTENKIYFNECIFGGSHENSDQYWNYDPARINPADISDIQQYLPNGHVDKKSDGIPKCIEGKWYKSTHSLYVKINAIKFKAWDSGYDCIPLFSDAIVDGKRQADYNNGGIWNSYFGKGLTECSLDEIQEYLPDGHPDKKIKNDTTIQVGDTVRCVGNSNNSKAGESSGWRKDHEFVVKSVDFVSSGKYKIYFGGINGNGVYSDSVVLVKRKSDKPVAVGQFVRALIDYPNGGSVKADEIGEVINVLSDTVIIKFPSHSSYTVGFDSIKSNRYEILPIGTPKPEAKLEPKIGNYIKALVDYPNGGKVRKGEIGLIHSVSPHSFGAQFPSQHAYNCSVERLGTRYELMPDGWEPSSSDNAHGCRGAFKKGGWVRCIAEAKTNKSSYYNQFKVGEYYEILSVDSDIVTTVEGYILLFRKGSIYDIECEWYGMTPPFGYRAKSTVSDASDSVSSSSKPVVGQYIQALMKSPEGGNVEKNDYGEVTSVGYNSLRVDFPNHSYYDLDIKFLGVRYAVMPLGWKPAGVASTPITPKVGGWIRCIAEAKTNKSLYYNQFKVGEYYQVKSQNSQYVETTEGLKLNFVKSTDYDIECEWVGMTKPTEVSIKVTKTHFTDTPDIGELLSTKAATAIDTYVEEIEEPWTELRDIKVSDKIIQ
jgi:hypothetical protein